MSIIVDSVDGYGVEVTAIEYRPGEGLVLRVVDENPEALARLAADLPAVLRDSPYRIYRTCCDSTPGASHLGTCDNSLMKGGKGT